MSVDVSVGDIWGFYNKNKYALRNEYRMVAEDEESSVEIYITCENDVPYFTVELDGAAVYEEAAGGSQSETEMVYSQLLKLYILEDGSGACLDDEDISRIEEIRTAAIEFLGTLFECDPEACLGEDSIDEVISIFEESLYDIYGISVRHPIVNGNDVIQYPFSSEEV